MTVNSNVLANAKTPTGVLDFSKFDTSLGTLQSVKIDLYSDFSTIISVENTSRSSPATILGTATGHLTLSTPSTGALATLTSTASHSFSETIYDSHNDFAGTSGGVYASGPSLFSSTHTYSDAATLALFSGAGLLHTNLAGSATALVQGISGNTRSLVISSFDAYSHVTYNYISAVPEPETYAMLLGGLGLLGFIARRRRTA
ncbi:FxDxF family PEP-CTERM protein [Janthinobacterium sp.]|uniref:FxDxF family PEP-CTERM protein n=1 Tax=Janthinobacterium sp. TaxID=1871054 RepID=UPI00293D5A1A|nr:FxDxF family PEP-CTERM protein [Janthinobacterium sp.]